MGFLSWLFGKENDPPEPLVLGAKLRCPYGDQDSYLMVFSDDIDINNLPKATVDDCRPIMERRLLLLNLFLYALNQE